MLCPPGQDERKMIMPSYYDKDQKTYYCKFYYTDWTGQRKQKLKRGFTRQRDAKDWERTFLEKQQGTPDMTFQALYDLYMEDMEHRLKCTTVKMRKCIFVPHILPYFKDKAINEITPGDIRKWQNMIIKNGFSDSYMNAIHRQLTIIFNYAVKYYNLSRNPCRIAGAIGKATKRLDFWTLNEFTDFIAHVDDLTLKTAHLVLFYTGLRIGELLALQVKDYDSVAGTLTVNKTCHRFNKDDLITPPKTDNSNRTVTLPSFLMNNLSDYIGRNYNMQPEDRLFQVSRWKIRDSMKTACVASGVRQIRIHDIRHSHVSLLIDMGFTPLLIAERIGDTVEMVNTVYGHLYPNRHNEVAEKLQELVSK